MTMALLLASTTLAQAAPPQDMQIRVVPYSPLVRTELTGVVGHPTVITFPAGEAILHIVQSSKPGTEGNWRAPLEDQAGKIPPPVGNQAPPVNNPMQLGNNLTIWPAAPGESTMSVITAVTAEANLQKVYPFRLHAIADDPGASDSADITLNLIFRGTGGPPPVAGAALPIRRVMAVRRTAADLADAQEHLRTDAFNGADDACHYTAKGKQPNAITPRCPMDNGQWTLMRFPGLSSKPAVYVVTGEHEERLARQHGAGDFVVVEEIARHFRLRLGPDVLDILNDAYDPVGKPAGTGTTSPTVARDIIQAKRP
jgi:type IV secretory pathway VirB9-like protein